MYVGASGLGLRLLPVTPKALGTSRSRSRRSLVATEVQRGCGLTVSRS